MAIGTAAALIGSAAIGAIGSSKAAKTAASSADAASATQLAMYSQTREDQAPWRDIGTQAIQELGSLYGFTPGAGAGAAIGSTQAGPTQQDAYEAYQRHLRVAYPIAGFKGTKMTFDEWLKYNPQYQQSAAGQAPSQQPSAAGGVSPTQQTAMSRFFTSPDYQFRLSEGQKAIERGAAARGGLLGGATQKSLAQYAGDLASGEYQNYANRLASLAGVGQTSAQQLGTLGAETAGQIGQAQMQAGQARASGYLGTANTINNALQNYQMMQALQGGSVMPGVVPYSGGGGIVQSSSLGAGYANPLGQLF